MHSGNFESLRKHKIVSRQFLIRWHEFVTVKNFFGSDSKNDIIFKLYANAILRILTQFLKIHF